MRALKEVATEGVITNLQLHDTKCGTAFTPLSNGQEGCEGVDTFESAAGSLGNDFTPNTVLHSTGHEAKIRRPFVGGL
jgi:hypothetical protein